MLVDPSILHFEAELSHSNIARALLETGEFESSHRGPVYPLVLAAIFWAFGKAEHFGVAIFGFLTALFALAGTYRISLKLFGPVPALFAFLFVALDLCFLFNSFSNDLPDVFFISIAVWAVYFLLIYLDSSAWRHILVSGALFCMAFLTKPIGLYLPILAAIVLLCRAVVERQMGALLKISVFVLLIAGASQAWSYRNFEKTGAWTFNSLAGSHYLFYFGSYILSDVTGRPMGEIKRELQDARFADPAVKALDPERLERADYFYSAVRNKHFLSEFKGLVRDHPFSFLTVTLVGVAKTLVGGGFPLALSFYSHAERDALMNEANLGLYGKRILLFDAWYREMYLVAASVLYEYAFALIFWGMFSYGVILQLKNYRHLFWAKFLLVLCIGYLAIAVGPVAHKRYRLAFEVFAAGFAGYGLVQAIDRVARARRRRNEFI